MQASESNNAGFSLVEILVAVVILSMISATLWVTLSRSMDLQEEIRGTDERVHEIRATLERLAKEVSMAYLSQNQSQDRRTRTLFLGKNNAQDDRLDFTSMSHTKILLNAKESDQCEISYYTERVGDGIALFRREDAQLDKDAESGGTRYILLDNIKGFNLRYWDQRYNTWREDWDSNSRFFRNQLPVKVEMTVTFENHRGEEESAVTSTPLYMMDILN